MDASSTEEWVEILVPGYGKCWVDPDAAHDRYLSDLNSYNWTGITDLKLVTQVAKSSTDKVFTQFFQLVGHDLVNLVLHTNLLREQGLGAILRSCPNLKSLELNGAQVHDMFAFTHGYDVGYCQIKALSIEHFRVSPSSLKEFAKVLSDPDREAARHICKLCIGKLRIQDIDVAVADYEAMIETFVRMLDTNTTLEYLKLYIEGDFYTRFARSFSAHDGEQLPPEELSSTRKLAFISIVHSGKSKRLENRLVRLIFRYAARRVTREVCIMNY
ncbi:DNA topoisomerase 3-alpha [Phytophthora nicotianae]|nr:DNA topoisomerase 3-alpha [Phytophthora nicotianae]